MPHQETTFHPEIEYRTLIRHFLDTGRAELRLEKNEKCNFVLEQDHDRSKTHIIIRLQFTSGEKSVTGSVKISFEHKSKFPEPPILFKEWVEDRNLVEGRGLMKTATILGMIYCYEQHGLSTFTGVPDTIVPLDMIVRSRPTGMYGGYSFTTSPIGEQQEIVTEVQKNS